MIVSQPMVYNLRQAEAAKNDEFYMHYLDIQLGVNAFLDYDLNSFQGKTVLLSCDAPEWSDFKCFFARIFRICGLKKLISTSYAIASKHSKTYWTPILFVIAHTHYEAYSTKAHDKMPILYRSIDIKDLYRDDWDTGGDFRLAEMTQDEDDIIGTNPIFSPFREFLTWVFGGSEIFSSLAYLCDSFPSITQINDVRQGKMLLLPMLFFIIGTKNVIICKEMFPLIKENKIVLGATRCGSDIIFGVHFYTRLGNSCWLIKREHCLRHEPLMLMTMADNIKNSKHNALSYIID